MPYCTQQDVEAAFGVHTIKAIFDDDNDGVADPVPMAACLEYGSVQVDAFLIGTYPLPFPIVNPPAVVRFAAVDFCCAYAARRRPDIVRAMGEKSWTDFNTAAVDTMKRYVVGLTRLPTETIPAPANVGGHTIDDGNRLVIANADGTSNIGDY